MVKLTHKPSNGQVSSQTWRGIQPVHPAAELLPAMTDDELRELGDDIKRHGQRVPVVILTDAEGTEYLLDGRNRLDAMERAGMPVVKDGELNRDFVNIENVAAMSNPTLSC